MGVDRYVVNHHIRIDLIKEACKLGKPGTRAVTSRKQPTSNSNKTATLKTGIGVAASYTYTSFELAQHTRVLLSFEKINTRCLNFFLLSHHLRSM